ncbi:hypothetical protein JKF63_04204 [Porcisia hertigi]|uniref:Uncharacterized protein n=1 Tax=Porcisia hertigi TaxID=2761500 RepID=A0A836L825_9TRYP|nr:hypothetical protein JKF63_04204 [Porcisia hertigi]
MVKKGENHVRVLRSGESIPLSFTSSEFEIVLFRPRYHNRVKTTGDSVLETEGDLVTLEGYFPPKSVNNTEGVNTTISDARTSLTGNEARRDEKKKGVPGPAGLRSSALGSRDSSGAIDVDDPTASPPARKATGGGNEAGARGDSAMDAPLFFDTTVCIFYDGLTKMDYVAMGRTTSDSKGIHYKPHMVVLGSEATSTGYCNFNITRSDGDSFEESEDEVLEEDTEAVPSRTAASNGPVTMAAADGVEVCLRRLSMCAGFLVCATLFGQDSSLNREHNVFYMVRRPRSSMPHCLVPLCVHGEPSSSCVALMVRKVRIHGETLWELVNVGEPLASQDVKSLLLKLQQRGLADPAHFVRDYEVKGVANRGGDAVGGGSEGDAFSSSAEDSSSEVTTSTSQNCLSDAIEAERSGTSVQASVIGEGEYPLPSNRSGRTFSTLLVDVPRVAREGRRQYNVGRSHVQTALFDGDAPGVDEVLDDAMRAVVPCYANASLVRYENGAYNVGSKVDNLVTHYVDHRETYGLYAAGQQSISAGRLGGSKDKLLPHLGASRPVSLADCAARPTVLDRYQSDDSELTARPELPPDLLLTSQERLRAAALQQHRVSSNVNNKKRRSIVGRVSRSSSRSKRKGRKGSRRTPGRRARGKSRSKSKSKSRRGGKKPKGGRRSNSTSRASRNHSVNASPPRSLSSFAGKGVAQSM